MAIKHGTLYTGTKLPVSKWNEEHTDVETAVAGVALGGNRVVVLNDEGKAIHADKDEVTHISKVWGVTTGAVSNGASVAIQTRGKMVEPSWAWTLNQLIFLGSNGLLTQTSPSSGFRCPVAFPLTNTSIQIDIKESILLV